MNKKTSNDLQNTMQKQKRQNNKKFTKVFIKGK